MARLHEYQAKVILAANGFKIPRGRAASTVHDAFAALFEKRPELFNLLAGFRSG